MEGTDRKKEFLQADEKLSLVERKGKKKRWHETNKEKNEFKQEEKEG